MVSYIQINYGIYIVLLLYINSAMYIVQLLVFTVHMMSYVHLMVYTCALLGLQQSFSLLTVSYLGFNWYTLQHASIATSILKH